MSQSPDEDYLPCESCGGKVADAVINEQDGGCVIAWCVKCVDGVALATPYVFHPRDKGRIVQLEAENAKLCERIAKLEAYSELATDLANSSMEQAE